MLKKIEFATELTTALSRGLVLLIDNSGHRFVTTNAELADASALAMISGGDDFNSTRDLAVWNLLDGKPEVVQPLLFTGLMYDMGVNRPIPGSSASEGPIIAEGFDGSQEMYLANTKTPVAFMTKMTGSHPYLFIRTDEDGNQHVLQVDENGQNESGRTLISDAPTYSEEETYVEVTGYLVLSKTEGPVFLSQALVMGDLNAKTPGVDLSDGSMMVKAIQHVHRDHGVIGYAFNA